MVAARRKLGKDDWDKLILELRPNWLVLRPGEARTVYQKDKAILTKMYSRAQSSMSPSKSKPAIIPGRPYLLYDQTFLIFKRNP